MCLKSKISKISKMIDEPPFKKFWFILITVLGLALSALLDKILGKTNGISLTDKISLAELIIAIIIIVISIVSIISIAGVYNDYMKRIQSAHETCMKQVENAHENCKSRAKDAHVNCENYVHKLKTTVLYKEEIYSSKGISSDNLGYDILAKYIKEAENRILQVTSAPFGNLEEDDYPSRKKYFETLLTKIEEKKDNHDFVFGRIHQVHDINESLPALDKGYKEFYENLINFPTKYTNIGLLKVETNRLYGFTIIDKKYLIIQMSGLKNGNEKAPVASGIFIFTDYDGSSIIKDFARYYESIYRNHDTKTIRLDELSEKKQITA